jgi:hypothetical protein
MLERKPIWKSIFQTYGLMAMRSERHGKLFAKLNYGNVSDGRMRVEEKA